MQSTCGRDPFRPGGVCSGRELASDAGRSIVLSVEVVITALIDPIRIADAVFRIRKDPERATCLFYGVSWWRTHIGSRGYTSSNSCQGEHCDRTKAAERTPLDMAQEPGIKSTHYSGCSSARRPGQHVIFHDGAKDRISRRGLSTRTAKQSHRG